MAKIFGSVRTKVVATLMMAVGGLALTGCSSGCGGCDPCKAGPPVYRKPCCAQSGGYMAPAPMGAPAPAPAPAAGGQMACGAGKCG